jgi:actin
MLEEDAQAQTVVMVNGSGNNYCGFAGEQFPLCTKQNFVVYPPRRKHLEQGFLDRHYFGDWEQRNNCGGAIHPIEKWDTFNWDALERVWQNLFYFEAKVAPEEHPVLLTDNSATQTSGYKARLIYEMMETLWIPMLYIAKQAALSLYASGRTTGMVVESGFGVTNTVPIYEGHELVLTTNTLKVGGNDITTNLMRHFEEKQEYAPLDYFDKMKEKHCYVSQDDSNETAQASYELPDGNSIQLGEELYKYSEILFEPNGVHLLAIDSIQKCDVDIRSTMYSNVVLAGGNTLLRGFSTRFTSEVAKLAEIEVNVEAPENRLQSCWFGGSIFAAISSKDGWLTKQQYDEMGSYVVAARMFF